MNNLFLSYIPLGLALSLGQLATPHWASADVLLEHSWSISKDNVPLTPKDGAADFSWSRERDLGKPSELLTLRYETRFVLSDKQVHEAGQYLVLPQFIGGVSVSINGHKVYDQLSEFQKPVPLSIYRNRIVPTSGTLRAGKNRIAIDAQSTQRLGGWQNTKFTLVGQDSLFKYRLKNFVQNDLIWIIFLPLLVLVLSASSFLCLFEHPRRKIFALTAISAGLMVPALLTASPIYGTLAVPLDGPIRIAELAQLLTWPFVLGLFAISFSSNIQLNKQVKSKTTQIAFFSFISFVTMAYLWGYSHPEFQNVIRWSLTGYAIASVFILFGLMQKTKKHVNQAAWVATALLIFGEILYLHVTGLNVPVGLSVTSLLTIMFFSVVYDFIQDSRRVVSLASLVQVFLPPVVIKNIQGHLDRGKSIDEIQEQLTGTAVLTNVFVDICDWGKMSSTLSSDKIDSARNIFFQYVGNIANRYNLSLIKFVGDNLHLCGGLFNESQNRFQPDDTMKAVLEIIDNIDQLKRELESKQLPIINLKVSATIGLCKHSLLGYRDNLRFDIEGYWLVVAKRQEEAMNEKVYTRYGRNIAVISKGLMQAGNDIEILKRFHRPQTIQDKSGQSYYAYLATSKDQDVPAKKEFLKKFYGQFAHQPKEKKSIGALLNLTPEAQGPKQAS